MSMQVATTVIAVLGAWFGIGLAFALLFVVFGVERCDPSARGGSYGFRLAILPGVAALWPWMLLRWLRGGPPPEPRDAHRRAVARSPDGGRPAGRQPDAQPQQEVSP